MIRYALTCAAGHSFESWFGSSEAFDGLAGKGLVSCPSCGSTRVGKAIMAPAVARSAERAVVPPQQPATAQAPAREQLPAAEGCDARDHGHREIRDRVRALRAKVLAGTQDVGSRFPQEVRRMHDGDIPHRDIRGEATLEEARSLIGEGIMILPVPGLPDELN